MPASAAIQYYYDRHGAEAVAVKNQGAYNRRLDFEEVAPETAAPLFACWRAGEKEGQEDDALVLGRREDASEGVDNGR
jgi:hypothetical protein